MQELLNKLTAEVGLNAEQAAKTVQVVMDFVKSKLPPSVAGNFDQFLAGNLAGNEESFKEKAEDLAEAAKDKLEDFAEQARDKLSDAADKAEEMAKEAFDKIKGMFGHEKKE